MFHQNHILNLGNHYHEGATQVAPGIAESSKNHIIPHQIDKH